MYKTLIVDDDQDTLELLGSIFPAPQFETHLASDGHTACHKIDELEPDLVVLDVVIGGKNGFEVASHIQAAHQNPILFMITGYPEINGNSAYAVNAHMFLRKPMVSAEEVVAAALRHLKDRPPPPVWHMLSNREREIVSHIGKGLTTAEISRLLNISAKTVAKHRENILKRCGARNVAHLMAMTGVKLNSQ